MTPRERPTLFSGPMVRAILDGRKTQTRRVVTVRGHGGLPVPLPGCGSVQPLRDGTWEWSEDGGFDNDVHRLRCPFGQPGDRLWVRETWADLRGKGFDGQVGYGADTRPGSDGDQARIAYGIKWKPSIHMPRWASRITLEIIGVRVERLQEISVEDVIAEGFRLPGDPGSGPLFVATWNALAKPPFDWDANPWVWVIEFKRVEVAGG